MAGGTFPTEIWHDFMRSWIGIRERREAESGKKDDDEDEDAPYVPSQPAAPAGAVRPGRARGRRWRLARGAGRSRPGAAATHTGAAPRPRAYTHAPTGTGAHAARRGASRRRLTRLRATAATRCRWTGRRSARAGLPPA